MAKEIIKFDLPKHSWWQKLWCKHEWGSYMKKHNAWINCIQKVCILCGKEK